MRANSIQQNRSLHMSDCICTARECFLTISCGQRENKRAERCRKRGAGDGGDSPTSTMHPSVRTQGTPTLQVYLGNAAKPRRKHSRNPPKVHGLNPSKDRLRQCIPENNEGDGERVFNKLRLQLKPRHVLGIISGAPRRRHRQEELLSFTISQWLRQRVRRLRQPAG